MFAILMPRKQEHGSVNRRKKKTSPQEISGRRLSFEVLEVRRLLTIVAPGPQLFAFTPDSDVGSPYSVEWSVSINGSAYSNVATTTDVASEMIECKNGYNSVKATVSWEETTSNTYYGYWQYWNYDTDTGDYDIGAGKSGTESYSPNQPTTPQYLDDGNTEEDWILTSTVPNQEDESYDYVDFANETSTYNGVPAIAVDGEPPGAPAKLAMTPTTGQGNYLGQPITNSQDPTFSWQAAVDPSSPTQPSSGIQEYYYALEGRRGWESSGLSTSTPLSGLADGAYTFSVYAVDKCDNQGDSSSTTFIVQATPPATPPAASVSVDRDQLTANVGWLTSDPNDPYYWQSEIKVTTAGGSTFLDETITGDSHEVTNLSAATEYVVSVRNEDVAGNWSDWSASVPFTIKATPVVDVTDAGGTYNGQPFVATATVAGVDNTPATSLEGVSPTLDYYAGTSASGPTLSGAPTNVGTYTVAASFAGSADYDSATSAPVTFTITQATPVVVVTDAGGTYNGQPFPATATVAGEAVSATFAYYAGTGASGTALAEAPTNAGTYTVVASFPGSADYDSAISAPVTFTITQATPVVVVTDDGGTYNGQPFPGTATVAGVDQTLATNLEGVSPTLAYYAGTSASGTPLAGAPANAGTYTVVASFPGSTDYGIAASVPDTFTIKATPVVVVTDAGGTYNGQPFPATATVAGVGSQSSPMATLEGVGTTFNYYVGSGTGGTDMGDTAPTEGGAYTVVASFAGSQDYTSATSAPVSFIIDKATLVIVVRDPGGTYNGQPFPATATVNGVDYTLVGLEGVILTFAYYAGTSASGTDLGDTAPTAAGTYTVVASFPGSADYESATSAPDTFTIAQATPDVVVTDAGGTYNGQPFVATATVAGVDQTPAASLEGVSPTLAYYAGTSANGTSLADAPTNAGTYTVIALFAGSGDYESVTSDPDTFTITPATPVVVVTDAGGTYNGQPFPATATVAGVGSQSAPAQTLENVGTTLDYYAGSDTSGTDLEDTPPVNVGTYTVVASFAGSQDYTSATSDPVTFTITPATPTGVKTTALTNECKLSWDAVPGADSYQVWRNTSNNQPAATEIASGITSTTYDDAMAAPGTTYYYWVAAASGSQTSPFSAPVSGTANIGVTGAIILGPLELAGDFSVSSDSSHSANGSVQIGFAPGSGQTFQPLLTVAGSVTYDDSIVSITGTVSPDIGNLTFPLLVGSFQIPVGQTATSPNTVNDSDPAKGLQIAGLPIYITGLALIPAGPSLSNAEIEVTGNISLMNTTLSATILVTDQGLQLASTSLALPNASFSVGAFSVNATGMSLTYDSAEDQFTAQGKLTLDNLIHGENVTADLTGEGNGVFIQGSNVNLVGTLSLNDLTLPNGWGLKQATLSVNTLTGTYGGSAELDIPGLFDVGGTIAFLNGHLNALSLSIANLASPVPLVDVPGLFLTGGSASIDNLAPNATDPVTLGGTLDFSYGPAVPISLPSWLGGSFNASIASLVVGASMSTDDLSGSATVTLAGGLGTIGGTVDLNLSTETLTASGTINLARNAFTGSGTLTIGDGSVSVSATGSAQLPLHEINSVFPNLPLGSAGLALSYQQSSPLAQDYVQFWGKLSLPVLFGTVTVATPLIQVGFDGKVTLRSATDLPQTDPPASTTFSLAPGTPWALLGASWSNSNSNVAFSLTSPDGVVHTVSNLPSNVGVINEPDNSTQVVVGIQNPAPGNWTLALADATGLGNVAFGGVSGTTVSGVHLSLLEFPANAICGSSFDPPIIVAVDDQNGDVISTDNSTVTLKLTAPGGANTVFTNQAKNGIATFNDYAPQTAGNYTLVATDGTDTPVSATLSIVPAYVSSLTFVQQPTNAAAEQSITPPVVVQAKDPYGNVISGDTVTLEMETSSGGLTSNFYNATSDKSGNATFGGISTLWAGSYMLVATDGLASSNSKTFAVGPAVAWSLVFAQQPSNAPAGSAINPNVVVDIEDQFGNILTTDNSNATLSLYGGNGALSGPLTVQAKKGVATFSGLSVSAAGIYRILANDGTLLGASQAFTITRATPTVTLASPPQSIIYDGTGDVTNWAIPSVSGARGAANPTGSPNVVFYAGTSAAGTPLASTPVNVGTYTAIASYSGDVSYSATPSAPVTFAIINGVTSVSSTQGPGDYATGTTIQIMVTFSEPVTVTGSPQLALNAGNGATAYYDASLSTSSTLTFTYLVLAGQSTRDLDSTSTAALTLNGGSIRDAAGNPAVLTLPPIGTDGLAAKNIAINITELTVTNTLDSGPGSLRQAILDANAAADPATIGFQIAGGGLQTISPISPLPALTNLVVIDGTSEPGYAGAPLIVLNGALAGASANGLTLTAGSSTIEGLDINSFALSGIVLQGNGDDVIAGNYLGTDASGLLALPNGLRGLYVNNVSGNTIGGITSAARNVISGNLDQGVLLSGGGATNNTIEGNYVGLGADGQTAIPNRLNDIYIFSGSNNMIGGTVPGARNVISCAGANGVWIDSGGATGNQIEGNYIGTDSSGTLARGNAGIGVGLYGISGNTIGPDNVIAASGGVAGVYLAGPSNLVDGNYIGTDKTGNVALPNHAWGICVENVSGNTIGGITSAARNVISGNLEYGVFLSGGGAANNTIEGNYIGLGEDGSTRLGNGLNDVYIWCGSNNTVGGVVTGARNVISCAGANGVWIDGPGATGNQIEGNYIGTDSSGTLARGNTADGVGLQGVSGNTIGGGNVIAASGGLAGVYLAGPNNQVEGNYIGTDSTGNLALGNAFEGVYVDDASGNLIGGTASAVRNVISGNGEHGVWLSGGGATSNTIAGNYIGLGEDGQTAVPNGLNDVYIYAASNNMIGGTGIAGNVIANAGANGVWIDGPGATGNQIEGNDIYASHANGVGIMGASVSGNAISQNETYNNIESGILLVSGANNNQLPPSLTSAIRNSATGTVTIDGTLTRGPAYLEFFSSDLDPSGNVEGQEFLGETEITAAGNGNWTFSFTSSDAVTAGKYVTATATDANGNTSQFSRYAVVTSPPTAVPYVSEVIARSGLPAGGATVTINGLNLSAATAVDFGASSATFTVDSDTQITATSPAGVPGTVNVTVTTPKGTSAVWSTDQFTYAATPSVSGISATLGPTSGGTSLTITGTDLAGATEVDFGSVVATITNDTATQIVATSPAESAATVDVTVTTPSGASTPTPLDQFTYVQPAPVVFGLSPSSGPLVGGTSVAITGTNLAGATMVDFGSTAAKIKSDTATQIIATSPAGWAGTVDVTVTTPAGTSGIGRDDQFTYGTAPMAASDCYTVSQGEVLSVAVPGVLANDNDPQGYALTATVVSNPVHGTLSLNNDGSFTYTPASGYIGADGFTYRASDAYASSDVTTVAISIAPATPTVALNWTGAGNVLNLVENSSVATPAITISEPSPNISLLKIDLGAGYSFANTSTTSATGLMYQNPGSPTTSRYATIDISQTNSVSSLVATLPGDDLTLGQIRDLSGGVGSIVASAGTIEVTGIDTYNSNGNVDLKATGNLTVESGATIETGTGMISLAADVNADGTGNDGVGTLSINAGATVVSSNPTASAITLRGADINIDTSSNPAVVGAHRLLGTTPSSTLTGLSGPAALAFDGSGNIYVANYGNGTGTTVSEFAPGRTTPSATLTGLNGPYALAFDASGNLYVANYGNNGTGTTVSEFAPGSTTPTATLTDLYAPRALAFDRSGNLYVATQGSNTVSEFGPGNTTPSATLTGVVNPVSLALDGGDNLYVANEGGTVSEFAPGSTTPSRILTGVRQPVSLAFDSTGNLYVADEWGTTVGKFAPGSTTPSATLTGLTDPFGLAFDGSGNLYVANFGASTVSKFSPGSTTPSATLTGLYYPYALAFDDSGNLYVTNAYNGTTVSEFAPGSSTSPTAGGVVIRSSLGSRPMSLGGTKNAVAGVNLTDAELAQIQTNATGTVTIGDSTQTGNITFTTATPATTAGAATQVVQAAAGAGQIILDDASGTGTALNANGGTITLTAGSGGIVAASGNNGAAEIGTTGATVTLDTTGPIGTSGNRIQFADNANPAQQNVIIGQIGSTNEPSGVFLDGLGSLTLDNIQGGMVNTAIDVTARTNLVVAAGGTINSGTSTLSLGADLKADGTGDDGVGTLSIDAGATVVSSNPTASAITLRGADVDIDSSSNPAVVGAQRLLSTTASATLPGLNAPDAMAFDASGNLYVADYGSDTVSKFAPGSTTSSATLMGVHTPVALAFDASGNLYVANFLGTTVSEFAPGSTTPTATLTGLDVPQALAFDSNGNLYVANEGGTVSKFAPGSTTASATFTGVPEPVSLAFDRNGNLYVGNEWGTTVSEFAPGSTTPTATLTGVFDPFALAFDGSGNLYVANFGVNYASKFAPGSTTPSATLTGLNGPRALAFDASGNLYGANFAGNTVSEFTPGSTTPIATLTGLNQPVAQVFDSSGDLYVANYAGNTVSEFAPETSPTAGGVVIRSSLPTLPMSLGGSKNAVAGINLTDAELAQIQTTASGTVTIGDSTQTGDITFTTATPATTTGAATRVVQAAGGAGQIILDDASGTGTALNGNGGTIALTAGSGGIVAASGNNGAAEIGTSGATVTLNTTGPIGTSGNRIQFADDANPAQQNVIIGQIGSTNEPSSVFLDGLGGLTLGNIQGGTVNTAIDVTARTILVVAAGATISSGASTLSLAADVNTDGTGNDGVGTLSIGAGATVVSSNPTASAITLRGAEIDIDTSSNPAVVGTPRVLGTAPSATFTGLDFPGALAFDSNGNLYVANYGGICTVSEFASGSTSPTNTLTDSNGSPYALAFDGNGNLYVANSDGRTVSKFVPGSTTPSATFTGLDGPLAMAFDGSGNLYVANFDGTTVSEFAPGSTTPTATLTGLDGPYALAFDESGNLYVANSDGTTVSEFAPGSTTPIATLTGLNGPRAMAFDSSGNLYVANWSSKTVSEFAPGCTTPSATLTGLLDPYALALDGSGNLYVANLDGTTVSEFGPASTTPSATLTGLDNPAALAFDSSGDLYVANSANNTVSKFTSASLGSPTAGGVVIRSSLGSRPMGLGGTNNAVTGINLTDAELAQIQTTPTGTVTIGDSTQTGNITFTTTTPATTAGASTVVVQAAGGAGQIRLDDASGTGTALNGNGGSISLIAGRGGIQAQSVPNTAAEIGGATSVKLYSSGGIGTSEPLQLASTTLTTNTSGDQLLSALGTLTAISMNAGSGTIELLGGTLVASGSVSHRGGTFVTGGTLIVTASSALPDGGALTIGANAAIAFGIGDATPAAEPTISPAIRAAVSTTHVAPISTVSILGRSKFSTILASPLSSGASISARVFVAARSSASTVTSNRAVTGKSATAGASIAAIRNAAVQAAIVQQFTRDLAWLEATLNTSSSAGQDKKKGLAIDALDAVLAEYGQP